MFLFLLFFYCFGFQSIMISFEPEIQGKAAHICNIKLSFRFVSSHFALDHIELILKEDRTTYLNTSFGVKLDLLFSYYFESVGWNTEHIILSDVCLWCPASCGLDTYYVLLFYSNRGSGVDSNVQFFLQSGDSCVFDKWVAYNDMMSCFRLRLSRYQWICSPSWLTRGYSTWSNNSTTGTKLLLIRLVRKIHLWVFWLFSIAK